MSSNVSRRGFFRLATDSLFALPMVAGGFLAVDPHVALADDVPYESDVDGGAYGAGTEIIAVNPYETGFLVVDMANGGKDRVAGARVIVTSRFNKKRVEGVTDASGAVVLNIHDLAENPKKLEKLDSYAFNGTIEVVPSSNDYREFKVSLMRIEGGKGYRIPSRKITDDKPYPVSVSFDDWDVLYTAEVSFEDDIPSTADPNVREGVRYFGLSPENKDDHTIVITMKNFPSAAEQGDVQLVERDSGKSIFSSRVTASNGVAELRVTKKFLQGGSPDALPEKKFFDVWVTINGVRYSFPIRLQAEKTIFPKPGIAENKLAKPVVTKYNAYGVSDVFVELPPSFPLGGKDKFLMWLPDFPINVSVDPLGYFQLTMRSPSWGYTNDYGNPEDNGWKRFPRDSVAKQIEKKKESWDKMLSKAGNAYNREYGRCRQINFSSTFTAQGFFQFMAVASWDSKKGSFSGNAVGQFTVAMDYALSENFLAGPIPVLIQFGFKLSLTLSLGPGFTVTPKSDNLFENVTDLSLYKWDYTNTGLTLTIIFVPSLSVGVGIKGVASISLRGTFTLSFFVGLTMKPDDNKDQPHMILGYEYKAMIVAQFFLWSYEWGVFSGKDPQLYDNWNKSKGLSGQADQHDLLNPLADKSLEEVLADMVPVTDDMLKSTAEFENGVPITSQEEEGAPALVLESQYTEETVMGDGTVIPSIIYTLKVEGQEDVGAQDDAADVEAGESAGAGTEAPELDGLAASGGEVAATAASDAAMADGVQLEAMAEGVVAQSEDAVVAEQLAEAAVGLVAMDEESGETSGAYGEGDSAEAPVSEEPVYDGELLESTEAPAEEQLPEGEPVEDQGAETQSGDDSEYVRSPFSYDIPGNYEPVPGREEGDVGGLVAMADTTPGVAGLGDNGGIRLTADIAFLKGVFGNPRVEVVSIDGTVYTLRIASVLVNGKPRTRLISTVVSGYRLSGASQVLEFKINPSIEGILREELCDYEFAPQVGKDSSLEVALISGKRNTNDLASAATDLVLTYVKFHHHAENGFDSVVTSTSWLGSKVFANTEGLPYHCISNLDLTLNESVLGGSISTISYLDRMGNRPEDVLSDKTARPRLGIVFVPHRMGSTETTFVVPDPAVIESKVGKFDDLTAYELRFWPAVDNWYTFMIRGATKASYYVMRLGGVYDKPTVETVKCAVTLDDRCRFHAWKTEAETGGLAPIHTMRFLTCNEQGELCTARILNRWDEPKLEIQNVGPKDFGIISFGVWGDFIYWPEARDGSGGQTANPETGEIIDLPPVDDCHLMAARIYNNKFSDSFIMADLPHNIDTIVNVSGTGDALKVIGSELTDSKMDNATIWYMAIPFVKTATATDCEPVNPFVAPGKPARFYLTIRNDGNTFLKGCEAAMYDKGGSLTTPASVAKVTFSMDTIRESAWNPRGDDGKLKNVADDGSLAPGKTSVYLMEIVIPEGWSGRKDIAFITRNSEVVDGMIVAAADDEESHEIVDYSVVPEQGVSDIVLVDEYYWEEAFYDDAPVSVYSESDKSGSSTNGGGSATGGKSGNGSKKGLPKMGDTTNTSAIAGMAAAGAAIAAAGAYAKRRQEDDE